MTLTAKTNRSLIHKSHNIRNVNDTTRMRLRNEHLDSYTDDDRWRNENKPTTRVCCIPIAS